MSLKSTESQSENSNSFMSPKIALSQLGGYKESTKMQIMLSKTLQSTIPDNPDLSFSKFHLNETVHQNSF